MKKHLFVALVVLFCASMTSAQGSNDKWDMYGGYSLGRFTSNIRQATFTSSGGPETFSGLCTPATGEILGLNSQKFFCARRNFNGFDASITRNVGRYVGITGDVTGHWKKTSYVDIFTPPGAKQTLANDERLWNFLGGVQFKDNRRARRLKPFGHVLAGFARYTNRQSQTIDLFPQFNFTIQDRFTSFADGRRCRSSCWQTRRHSLDAVGLHAGIRARSKSTAYFRTFHGKLRRQNDEWSNDRSGHRISLGGLGQKPERAAGGRS